MSLTARQKAFADQIANGSSQSSAYRIAYHSKGNPRTVSKEASKLVQKPGIAAAVKGLRAKMQLKELRNIGLSIGLLQSARRASPFR